MKKSKKLAIIGGSAAATILLGATASLAFFIDKDWTSDTVTAGTVDVSLDDFNLTNTLNINPGDGDMSVYKNALNTGNTDTLREGTEHKMTFTVNNNGTKSVLTRNLITITCENIGIDPAYDVNPNKNTPYVRYGKSSSTGLTYDECSSVAFDGLMYYVDTNHPLTIETDDNHNKWIKGTIVEYDSITGKYYIQDPDTGDKTTFTASSDKFKNIVHWPTVSLPADAFGLLYELQYAEETLPENSGVKDKIVTNTLEVDCIPTDEGNVYSGVDLYALHSKKISAGYEVYSRTYYESNSDAISIRYITPVIELAAIPGSIEDKDGSGATQNRYNTCGGQVYDGDEDSVYYTYWLEMLKEAPNYYQGATIHLDIEVQAMQYRNTNDDDWKTLHKTSYDLTVENAATSYTSIHDYNK